MSKEKELKPIVIMDAAGNPEYTLTFTRESVKWAEERGFKISEVTDYPLTGISSLFFFAFRANHKGIGRPETDEVYKELKANRQAVITRLIEMYNASLESLMSDTTDEKNSTRAVEL